MAAPETEFETIKIPGEDVFAAIAGVIDAFNIAKAGAYGQQALALVIRDEAGDITGGLWGESFYDWFFVKLLIVPAALRGTGMGTKLLAEAERIATERGCAGIWLDTFEFQARGFYEKQGYTLFGTLPDHPRGMSRFFMQKRLDAGHRAPASRSAN
jgi:GNAT superfamily N-acetyltransferase